MLKLGLLLVMLHALHVAHSHHKVHRGWDIITPELVHATRSSCLVIPCSYAVPKTSHIIRSYGMWKKLRRGYSALDVVGSWMNSPIHSDYKRRTSFLGQVQMKNCTWMLTQVRDSDAGLYYFRSELPGYNNYSWYTANTEVQVVDAKSPDLLLSEAGAGGDVLAYCSVTHSCPYEPPTLTWNRNGVVLNRLQRLSDWQWMTYSVLHLCSQSSTQELRCTVTYHGGQTLYSTVHF